MTRFIERVTVPVGIMVLIWAGLTAATLGGVFGSPGDWSGGRATVWTALICAAALVIVVVALMLTVSFIREIARETNDLAVAAHRIADVRLPAELEVLRAGGEPGERQPAPVTVSAVSASKSAEISDVSAAIADLHGAAIAAASAEAGLRNGLRQVLVSLGRRNQSLIHRQLRIIDKLEKQASGSSELGDLFTLDHLTTRMRRHAESLAVLAGEAPGRSWSSPVPVIDVMRAAAAEVEDYKRVVVRSEAEQSVAARAVTDMIHLLAELIENATLFSPSTTKVEVRAESVANGFVIEIEDRGLGIPPDQLREINMRLSSPPEEDLADADRLGLFVAARLAARHGVTVSLNPSAYRGTKAVVVLPQAVVVASTGDAARRLSGEQEAVGTGRLDLQAPGVLALAGSDRARRADPVTAGPSVFTPSLESLSHRDTPAPDPLAAHDPVPAARGFSGENFSAEGLVPNGVVIPGLRKPKPQPPQAKPHSERVTRAEVLPQQDSPPSWGALPQRGGAADGGPAPTAGFTPNSGQEAGDSPAAERPSASWLSGGKSPMGNSLAGGFSTANGLNLGRAASQAGGRPTGDAFSPPGGQPSGDAFSPPSARSSGDSFSPPSARPSGDAFSPPSARPNGDRPSLPGRRPSGDGFSPPSGRHHSSEGPAPASASQGGDWFTRTPSTTSSPGNAGSPAGNAGFSPSAPASTGSEEGTGSVASPGYPTAPGTPASNGAPAGAPGFPAGSGALPSPGPGSGDPAKPGLPRRVRPQRTRQVTRQAPPDSPVPDAARSLASSLQSNWRRAENEDDPGPGPGSASEEES